MSESNLIEAVARRNLVAVRTAIENGEDINLKGVDGNTALIEAVVQGDGDIASELLQRGADPNARNDEGWTALHFAAEEHKIELAALLLQHGAEIDVEDRHGNTPLARAVFSSRGRGDMIARLLAMNADKNHPNRYGVTPFDLAARIANYDVARFLR